MTHESPHLPEDLSQNSTSRVSSKAQRGPDAKPLVGEIIDFVLRKKETKTKKRMKEEEIDRWRI